VCGVYCPFDAIVDPRDKIVPRILPREIPKAEVIEELCTGCEFCVHVCPFDCIWLEAPDGDPANPVKIAVVDEKKCVSCKLCEQVCIKGAIVVPRDQDFPDIGWSYQPGAW
jgi:Pyruvate/2-oxoacid:ferredoxin oxidoreductase delta subunit